MDTRMGVEMELKVVKKDLQFAPANSNTKVVDMVSPAPPHAPSAKFKYEWYQTTSLVVVCILAKAAEEENLKVHFSEHILGMVINLREPLPCMLQLPLFGKVNHPPPIQYTTIQNKGSENWAKKYNALEARICELEQKMNAMTLELKEVFQTVLPSSSVPLPTQPSRLGANPKIVAEVARWFFPSWEPLEP
ncbi:unnamed protein product [Sphagnum jensenii]|uniref:CS domain-containing protein n=1 Tax=Sphagnum jensenii TaxID=128206 RepID=A0ABP1A1U1_9BRYO